VINEVAQDEKSLHFVGAFVDVEDARIAAVFFHFVHLGAAFDAHDFSAERMARCNASLA